MCCSVLRCVVVSCGCVKPIDMMPIVASVLQCAAVSCSVLQMCCSKLRSNKADCLDTFCYNLKCVAVSCSVLQCVAVCCSVLQ